MDELVTAVFASDGDRSRPVGRQGLFHGRSPVPRAFRRSRRTRKPSRHHRRRRHRRRRHRSRLPIFRLVLRSRISAATSWSGWATRRAADSAARRGAIPAAGAPRKPSMVRASGRGARPTGFPARPARKPISSAMIARRPAGSLALVPGSRRASMSASRSTRAEPASTCRWRCSRRPLT